MKVFEKSVCSKGGSDCEFLVDAHNTKVFEKYVCSKGGSDWEFLVDAHNMKVLEKFVCSKGAQIRSYLLMLTTWKSSKSLFVRRGLGLGVSC